LIVACVNEECSFIKRDFRLRINVSSHQPTITNFQIFNGHRSRILENLWINGNGRVPTASESISRFREENKSRTYRAVHAIAIYATNRSLQIENCSLLTIRQPMSHLLRDYRDYPAQPVAKRDAILIFRSPSINIFCDSATMKNLIKVINVCKSGCCAVRKARIRVNHNRRVTKAIIASVDDDEDRFQGGFVAACLTDCSGYERLRAFYHVLFLHFSFDSNRYYR